ncbi:helix-turn-helix domain-containing protein [Ligilactobacillus salivarius]|uniref:XRE family transcriptional regulator n=1 Tax=Ligilactobacillus salivarius TaxID=1624 RepID=A0A9X6S506_9LACO|nr:helix-turn-helix transcriptional regulator [Ligilactobacillus salivarius]PAY27440.1 XRE family transcriptional regulator [Ligilactobacillus salivarius]PAY29471.1 XRE family transcriptional regulator [Ligilactobacillus salivarius]PAY30737.1 XRE family transcriptional regulator [Ligilactobacillus salivarius]PAY33718.1 XRE family transcriptional regulator [Ligilactobacillus salivarius]PAY40724.1 XRE family transcriptional regulator [Ligilactobacillus salivarius]
MIGQTIRDLRKLKKMSQSELAKVVGVSQTTVTAWETGKAEPSSSAISSLADYFNVTTDYLLGRPEKKDDNVDYVALDKALDNARSFDGEPMDDHDREILRGILKGYFTTKK